MKIKALAGLPGKKAKFKSYINQRLSFAISLEARKMGNPEILRTATRVLCISAVAYTVFALDKRLRADFPGAAAAASARFRG
ncbi:hypothetical protein [Variovorax sp. W6]|uniref:hypothetical protein n=1 Tax=Variovorax sp. W6 TaxID=3093895 RepID=UPI003D809760